MKVYSKYNLPKDWHKPRYHSDKPSLTVPNQTLSIREMLERFTTGLLTPQSMWRDDIGDDISTLDNVNPVFDPSFDLSDRDVIKENAQQSAEKLNRITRSKPKKKEEEPATMTPPEANDKDAH